jgi:hypothetical protein
VAIANEFKDIPKSKPDGVVSKSVERVQITSTEKSKEKPTIVANLPPVAQTLSQQVPINFTVSSSEKQIVAEPKYYDPLSAITPTPAVSTPFGKPQVVPIIEIGKEEWRPNFNSTNPWEGMPSDYQKREVESFKPSYPGELPPSQSWLASEGKSLSVAGIDYLSGKVLVPTDVGGVVKLDVGEATHIYNELKDKEQFDAFINKGIIQKGSEYVLPSIEGGKWDYLTPDQIEERNKRVITQEVYDKGKALFRTYENPPEVGVWSEEFPKPEPTYNVEKLVKAVESGEITDKDVVDFFGQDTLDAIKYSVAQDKVNREVMSNAIDYYSKQNNFTVGNKNNLTDDEIKNLINAGMLPQALVIHFNQTGQDIKDIQTVVDKINEEYKAYQDAQSKLEPYKTGGTVVSEQITFDVDGKEITRKIGGTTPSEYSFDNLAKFKRENPDDTTTIETMYKNQELVDKINQYNKSLKDNLDEINQYMQDKDLGAKGIAIDNIMLANDIKASPKNVEYDMRIGAFKDTSTDEVLSTKDVLARKWNELSDSQKETIINELAKDPTKGNLFASINRTFQIVTEKGGLPAQILFSPIQPITNPIAKQLTLNDAREIMTNSYYAELDAVKDYVKDNKEVDINKLQNRLETDDNYRKDVLEKTGYENSQDLVDNLKYYNNGIKVSWQEWTDAGIVGALDLLTIGGAGALARLGLAGRIGGAAIPIGAGVYYAPSSIKTIMTPNIGIGEKVLAGVTPILLIGGGAIGLKAPKISGGLGEVKVPTKVIKLEPPKPLTQRIGEAISDIKTTGRTIGTAVMKTPEAVNYYSKLLGLKAGQIAELAEKGLLEVTPELASKIARNIKTGIMTAPEAIKYYGQELGLKANQIADLAKKGLLETTPELANRLANDLKVKGAIALADIKERVLSIPDAVNYYTNVLGLKVEQVTKLAEYGLLEVTPQMARRIAETIKIKGAVILADLKERVMTAPEAIDYYTKELGLKIEQLVDVAKSGLLETTPVIATKIAENIKIKAVLLGEKVLSVPEAIKYYKDEFKLKTEDIVELSRKGLSNISIDNIQKVIQTIKAKGVDKIVNLPDTIAYYSELYAEKLADTPEIIKEKIQGYFDEIKKAIDSRDERTIIQNARKLKLVIDSLADKKLSEYWANKIENITESAKKYTKTPEVLRDKVNVIKVEIDNSSKELSQTLNDILSQTRELELKTDTERISSDVLSDIESEGAILKSPEVKAGDYPEYRQKVETERARLERQKLEDIKRASESAEQRIKNIEKIKDEDLRFAEELKTRLDSIDQRTKNIKNLTNIERQQYIDDFNKTLESYKTLRERQAQANKEIINNLEEYLKNPNKELANDSNFNPKTVQDYIDRLRSETQVGLTPEEVALYEQINKDNIALNKAMEQVQGGKGETPQEKLQREGIEGLSGGRNMGQTGGSVGGTSNNALISELSTRSIENIKKLNDISLKKLKLRAEILDKPINDKLIELGYKDTDIERLSSLQKVDIIANNKKYISDLGESVARAYEQGIAKETVTKFTTSQGSTYEVDGIKTTRTKAQGIDEGDYGIKDQSDKTYYLTDEQITKLGTSNLNPNQVVRVVENGDLIIDAVTPSGKPYTINLGKTVLEPKVGLSPYEVWEVNRKAVHLGDKIISVETNPKQLSPEITKRLSELEIKTVEERAKLESIADKVQNREPLTLEESAFRTDNAQAIEDIIMERLRKERGETPLEPIKPIKEPWDVNKEPWNMTKDDIKNRYPYIPDNFIERIDEAILGGKQQPKQLGGKVTASNDQTLIHEIGHLDENALAPTDVLDNQWMQIHKEELNKGVYGDRPGNYGGDRSWAWEDLLEVFGITQKRLSGIKLTDSELLVLKNHPKSVKYVLDNLSKPIPESILKTYPDLVQKNIEDIVVRDLNPEQIKRWESIKPQKPSEIALGDRTENIGGKIHISKEQFELGYDDVAIRHELLHDTALENLDTFAKNVINAGDTATNKMHPSYSRYTNREKLSEDFVASASEWIDGTRYKDDLRVGRITPEEAKSRMDYFDNFPEYFKESLPQQLIRELKDRFSRAELVEREGKQLWRDTKDGELFAERGDYPELEPKIEELRKLDDGQGEGDVPAIPKEPEKPSGEGGGVKTAVKEAVEVKPEEKIGVETPEAEKLTAEEKAKKRVLTREELEKIAEKNVEPKPEITTEGGVSFRLPEKTTIDVTPFIIPSVEGLPYYAIVWENGEFVTKLITPIELTEGYIELETKKGNLLISREDLSRMTPEQARRLLDETDVDEYKKWSPQLINFPYNKAKEKLEVKEQPEPESKPSPEPSPDIIPITKPEPIPEPQPIPELVPEPSPEPQTMPEPLPQVKPKEAIEILTTKPFGLKLSEDEQAQKEILENPPVGVVVFVQGNPMYRGGTTAPMYKVIVPPYSQDDMFTTRQTPKGYVNEGYKGKGSAKKSIQIVGGLPPSNIENLDLGFVRINIDVSSGKPVISYVHDEDANSGERSLTVGEGRGQIPLEEWSKAKSQGISYDEFVNSYQGKLVGGNEEQKEVSPESEVLPEESVIIEDENVAEETLPEEKVIIVKDGESFDNDVKKQDESIRETAKDLSLPLILRGLEKQLKYQFGRKKVYAIDGDYVRTILSRNYPELKDFTQGGNWKVYPKMIPENHYWVDNVLKPNDFKATAIHEIVETDAMGMGRDKGEEYENAHADVANVIEFYARDNPKLLDSFLAKSLQGKWHTLLNEAQRYSSRIEESEEEPEEYEDINMAEELQNYDNNEKILAKPKKPKNYRSWFEDENDKTKQLVYSGGFYRGRKLLPPSIGVAL